ncbi:DUF4150 domain-containing protein [Pseudoduganella sp. HUAS MS19]
MSHEVYADGMEIAAKSGMNKAIAQFPDVCLSPPSPPAGPIPVPYPDTSFSTDLKEGSKTVKLGGQPAALAQQSYYQPATLGNEAATRSFGMSVITHQITGKTCFQAWSMDVLIEGRNVCRHGDIATSNHASDPGATLPSMTLEAQALLIDAGKCPCCNGPVHSAAQAANNGMPASAWYNPSYPGCPPNKAEQAAIELADTAIQMAQLENCTNILPSNEPTDPCSTHYAVSSAESKKGRQDFQDQMSPLTPEDYFVDTYGEEVAKQVLRQAEQNRSARRAGATSIAHKTALSAGGCPIGAGNHSPVSPKCSELEGVLGTVQGQISRYHQRALGL